jgi:hypothetical protein
VTHRGGRGEVDQDLRRGPQVVGDRRPDRADAGDLAGVASLQGVLGALDRADDLEVAGLLREGDEALTHASCGARDGDRRHTVLFASRLLIGRRNPRSFGPPPTWWWRG